MRGFFNVKLPPKPDAAQEAAFIKKAIVLAPKYRTELLREAK